MADREEPVFKVTFDGKTDFKFIAAYTTYSELFTEADDAEEKLRLNDLISQLYNEEISFQRFYSEINQHKEDLRRGRKFHRTKIQGQRKWAYRRDQQEKARIKRHKR